VTLPIADHPAAATAPPPARAARRLVPLAFLAAGVVWTAATIGIAMAVRDSSPDPLTAYAVIATLVGASIVGGLWMVVDRFLLGAAATLAAEARMIAHGRLGARVPVERFAELAGLAPAVNDLADKLAASRRDIDRAVTDSIANAEEQKLRLAAILHDLHEGVLVCNLRHQILLYNQASLGLLHLAGDLGLGRSLLQFVLPEPILHALERLKLRVREGRHRTHVNGASASFIGGTIDGRILMEGRMSLILQDADGGHEGTGAAITGYVVTLTDATGELTALGERDTLWREATDGIRAPIANLRAALETLIDTPDLDAEARGAFERAMAESCHDLSDRLEKVTERYRSVMTGTWPMSDIHSHNLVNLVRHRVSADDGYTVTLTGLPQWVHCDSFSVVVLLDYLLGTIHRLTGTPAFDLSTEHEGRWVYVDLSWLGAPLASGVVDSWLDDPLPDALGGLTVGDVLQHHGSTLWSEMLPGHDDTARLRLPLQPAVAPPCDVQDTVPRARIKERPEFFDFQLLHQPLATSGLGRTALERLHYVVFDTETTGLSPSSGDEIIQIAAVRIVNGRILTGEIFNRLVNPRRPIPAESMAVHGIDDSMVADQPGIEEVLPQFHAFASGAVLVAHNAAFDLKFLRMKEQASGVRFANPVLDTMLLSRMLQSGRGDHTLDGIAARLGIDVVDRHTALGDSLVTAAVYLRMVDMLRERNIRTLDDAIRGANMLVELAQRERAF
jgi:DNA polymerase-3 subunit epsilon